MARSSGCRFRVACEPGADDAQSGPVPPTSTPHRPVLDAAFSQKAILSRAVVAVGAAAALLAAGGLALALTLGGGEDGVVGTDVPPPTPEGFEIRSFDDTSVTLAWGASQGADGYTVQKVEDGTPGEPVDVPATQQLHTAENLEPGMEHCFSLTAFAGDPPLRSDPTETLCETTSEPGPTTSPLERADPYGYSSSDDNRPRQPLQLRLRRPRRPRLRHLSLASGSFLW